MIVRIVKVSQAAMPVKWYCGAFVPLSGTDFCCKLSNRLSTQTRVTIPDHLRKGCRLEIPRAHLEKDRGAKEEPYEMTWRKKPNVLASLKEDSPGSLQVSQALSWACV